MKANRVRGDIASLVLNLGPRQSSVVNFTPRQLHPRGNSPGTYWIGGWLVLRARDFFSWEQSCPCQESNLGTSSLYAYLSLPRIIYQYPGINYLRYEKYMGTTYVKFERKGGSFWISWTILLLYESHIVHILTNTYQPNAFTQPRYYNSPFWHDG
jgi:hypothetical protein